MPKHGKLAKPLVDPKVAAWVANTCADGTEILSRITTGSVSDGLDLASTSLRSYGAHQEADAELRRLEAAALQTRHEQHREQAAARRAAALAMPDNQSADPLPRPSTDHLLEVEHEPEAEPDL